MNPSDDDAVTGPITLSDDTAEPLLYGMDLEVDASWGHIYGPTTLTVQRGGVTVLKGSGGRGRTALLLTLAGRMKPSKGTLDAFGRVGDTQHLFSQSSIADIDEVDGIEQTIKVHDVLTEQVRWTSPWYRWVRQSTAEDLERLCRPVFGPYALPSLDAYVEELPELTASLFRIAMANVRHPELLVVGGVDRMSRDSSTAMLMERLVDMGRSQTIITADVNGVSANIGVRDVIEVHNLTDNEFVRLTQEDRN